MMPHIPSKGCETEQSPTHKTPWVFQIKTQKSKTWAVKSLGAQWLSKSPSKRIQTSKLSPTWKPFGNILPFATHCCMGQRSILEAMGTPAAQPLPVWRTSTLVHRRNLTQKQEALRRRMKANTLSLMQNTEVLQSVQKRAVELVKGLEHKSC